MQRKGMRPSFLTVAADFDGNPDVTFSETLVQKVLLGLALFDKSAKTGFRDRRQARNCKRRLDPVATE